MREFAQAQWTRAERALASAQQVAASDPDSAASRAYYAAYHAVTAFFALRGQSFQKHAGLRAAVHRDLVHAGIWSEELGQSYDFLMNLRLAGDYGGLTTVKAEDIQLALAKAASILEAVKKMCPQIKGAS